MKVFNLVFIAMFVLSAVLQYNDPDPVLWIILYLWPSFLLLRANRGKYISWAYWLTFVLYGAYAGYLFFETDGVWDWLTVHNAENIAVSMKAEKPWIEDAREFFGLIIMIVVLAINYRYAKNRKLLNK